MRGVVSEAMVMCTSSPDQVEILDPPEGVVPGDKVIVEGYEGAILQLLLYPLSNLSDFRSTR